MAAQLALLHAQRQRLFQQRRRGQRGQQLGVEQALDQRGRRGQVAHAPVGRQHLGKAADVDGAAQAVQHRQARGVVGRQVAVGVVFNNVETMALGQLQHLVRAARAQAVPGGVVQHADADKQFGRMRLAVARHDRQVGAVGAARHRQHAHAQRGQAGKFNRPAGFLHHHRVARPEQRAADDVQRVRGPHGGDDLPGLHRQVQLGQPARQHLAQAGVAQRVAVAERGALQRAAGGHLAHRRRQKARLFQPLRRKHARAGLRLAGRGLEHAADQRGGVDGRVRACTWPHGRGHRHPFHCCVFHSYQRLPCKG